MPVPIEYTHTLCDFWNFTRYLTRQLLRTRTNTGKQDRTMSLN